MNKINVIVLLCAAFFLPGCAVKTRVDNHYKLGEFSSKPSPIKHPTVSLLISQPESVAGYQTEQMLYIEKPYALSSFAHNAWVSSPANMLFPLIMQSMQHSHFFYAVATTPYADKADYRLDTQLIELQQNFLVRPSVVELGVKVVLTHVEDNRIIASCIIRQCISSPAETPYGGVVAANQATKLFTERLSTFVVSHIKRDRQPHAK